METLTDLITGDRAFGILRALVLLAIGLFAASLVSRLPQRLLGRRLTAHQSMLARRLLYYLVLALFVASAMHELGFSLSVLLGAAGVLSVAIGFASQTSASNLISGLFLIGERPFGIGDVITVGTTTGEVLSIDLLSVKLRTAENRYVRIPNEQLIKSQVITESRFPIRRFDITLSVAWRQDVERVRELLMALAERNPLCLDEPRPVFAFTGFGDSMLNIVLSVWARRENILDLRNSLQDEIRRAFIAEDIEMPSTERTLRVESETGPLKVSVVGDERSRTGAS